jgi:DNA repair exonuclease SbcCD ATPase subunit/predicted MPP superfamily phosphohydrolase
MRTIDIGLEKIDKIYHIADVHVRNVKRHKEYRIVFKRLYSYIKKTKTDNSIIYVAGDIVHAKTDMSPELIAVVSDFFKKLSDLAPTLIITGNHDCNLNNSYRLDALSPIVKALNHQNLHYLKDNGIYYISGVHFNVLSVFDKPVDYIKADSFDGDYKIALHHGSVHNASTDAGFTLSNTHVTTNMFEGHDLVLLGDIHKPQYLNDEKTIAYAGSLIQQNHGEALGHGIMVWDLETKKCEFVDIPNDYGYYTYQIDNGKIINPSDKIPLRPRLRLKVKDTDSATLKEIVAKIKSKYKVQDISIQKINALNTNDEKKKINFGNIRDVEWQNKVITEYLTDEYALDDELLDTIRHINRTVHSKLPTSTLTRNITWQPKKFEFSNMFSYGDNNQIDFTNMNGLYGLFAPNASGKSTLLDALSFCCFDKCSRTKFAKHVLNNKKSRFHCKFEFELGKYSYFIERNARKHNNGHVKVNVDFWRVDDSGNHESLNGDQRDSTNKIIQQYLGTYDDFVLTALSLQNNNTGFIDKSQRERKELLSQFLDIDIFEQLYQIGHDDIRETAALIREYKRKDFSTDLASARDIIMQYSGSYEQMKIDKNEHEEMKTNLNDIIFTMTKELKKVDDTLDSPEDIDKEIQSIEEDLEDIVMSRDSQKELIREQKKLIKETTQKINKIDEKSLQDALVEQKDYQDTVVKLNNDLKLKQLKIQHAEKMVSKLDKHEWDEDCSYCMANPWLQETKQVADLLPKLIDEEQAIEFDIKHFEDGIAKIEHEDKPKEKLEVLGKLKNNLNDSERTLINQERELESFKWQIHKGREDLKSKKSELKKSLKQLDNIEFNKTKNSEISEIRDEITTVSSELGQLHTKLLSLSGKLKMAEKTKQDAQGGINRLKELEQQYQGYEYYQKAVNRDGVPYHLITKALPQIESEINNILNQIVEFTIVLHTDGKNINAHIVYDDNNYWPLELTSGMEKFISSLAIRTSLINVSNLPRPNFLAIDEGFGVLDSDNLNSMFLLFDYLKSQFGFLMCISHIDAMRDIVDKLIEIKKVNGYSEINFT